MYMKENTAKNFVVQLGSLIALYVSVTSLLVLIFGIINITFPDVVSDYWVSDGAREGIRISIAMLIVFFPTYLALTRMSNQIRRKEESGLYNGLAKWLVYLSLLVGGGVILGDLVTILIYLLDGEVTARFMLKAFSLLVVISITFSYYLLDVRGHFKNKENESFMYAGGTTLIIIVAVLFGFMNIETPAEVRQMKIDDQQITDLQNIQMGVEEYYRLNAMLPSTVSELYDGGNIPQAPEGRVDYTYTVTGETNYELCATFVTASTNNDARQISSPIMEKNYSWIHTEGEKCFQRVVTENPKQLP